MEKTATSLGKVSIWRAAIALVAAIAGQRGMGSILAR
jgi:hypothetical protein